MPIKESILSGVLIGLGVIINAQSSTPEIGAFLFSFGLLTIIALQLPLFTGKIGFLIFQKNYLKYLGIVLIGNLLGIFCCILLYSIANPLFIEILITKAAIKFTKAILQMFLSGVFCGILIHLAIKIKHPLIIIMAVVIFILIGAEHCIADFPYLLADFSLINLLKFLTVVMGNSLGAIFVENILKKEDQML